MQLGLWFHLLKILAASLEPQATPDTHKSSSHSQTIFHKWKKQAAWSTAVPSTGKKKYDVM